jgi:hypothetical protein
MIMLIVGDGFFWNFTNNRDFIFEFSSWILIPIWFEIIHIFGSFPKLHNYEFFNFQIFLKILKKRENIDQLKSQNSRSFQWILFKLCRQSKQLIVSWFWELVMIFNQNDWISFRFFHLNCISMSRLCRRKALVILFTSSHMETSGSNIFVILIINLLWTETTFFHL